MSSEAKIGLGIVLVAVLVSVVLIGRTVSKKKETGPDGQPIAGAAVKPVYGGAPLAGTQEPPSSTPETFVVAGDSVDKLVSGTAPEGVPSTPSTPAAAGNPVPVPALTPTPATPAPVIGTPKTPVVEGPGADAAPADRTHTVARKGETLAEIARKYYGSSVKSKTDLIVKANPDVDFKKPLAVGTKLSVPEPPAKAATPDSGAAVPKKTADADAPAPVKKAPAGKVHKVEAGETLSILADRYLGRASRFPEILAVNPGLTKDSVLKVGQKVVIPEAR